MSNLSQLTLMQTLDYLCAVRENYVMTRDRLEDNVRKVRELESQARHLRDAVIPHCQSQLLQAKDKVARAERSIDVIHIDDDEDDGEDEYHHNVGGTQSLSASPPTQRHEADEAADDPGLERVYRGGDEDQVHTPVARRPPQRPTPPDPPL